MVGGLEGLSGVAVEGLVMIAWPCACNALGLYFVIDVEQGGQRWCMCWWTCTVVDQGRARGTCAAVGQRSYAVTLYTVTHLLFQQRILQAAMDCLCDAAPSPGFSSICLQMLADVNGAFE